MRCSLKISQALIELVLLGLSLECPSIWVYYVSVCYWFGAVCLQELSAHAMLQVGHCGGVAILVACLKVANVQTFENATGALWNCKCKPQMHLSFRHLGMYLSDSSGPKGKLLVGC